MRWKQIATDTIVQPQEPHPEAFMRRAEEMRRLAVKQGDQSFGAVVVKEGRIVGLGPSRVVINTDPTAHAEMEALRDAARRLGDRDLAGCVLFSTSRACPMCETAAHWANISEMIYGAGLTQAGRPQYRRCG